MLVLTRQKDESIVIRVGSTEIEVSVVSTGRARVKLGVQAPQTAVIVRSELLPGRQATGGRSGA